ncbi:CBS domain-containing protein CBSX3, mitochondrial-like [Juglans microcarpa x Juglans regia]|uniref:CBS domain-containing protein CBSX3, mitochondrial-like n=1 Tax=Juglans microcarpa x Juglans regia TaxID=2249226 RepID=UPI001B7DE0CC|nr:CBS domain-containing protein CBSX3, mitochondrial-like [Juglans microcarpa x Juglans regia]XP_040996891.1 CBS domain-containing protein CBSX3, mitochondrial-like [Juglans microcarpa x Juglans regia]
MQGLVRAIRSYQETFRAAILQQHGNGGAAFEVEKFLSRFGGVTSSSRSSPVQLKGLENVTVAEVLMTKGGEKVGSWLWCHTDDAVIHAVKKMAANNIGSLVVLKPVVQHLAGLVTERDYTMKIIGQGRSPTLTRVGEIMTDKDKLITVTSDTNILKAMQLMTENRIRHVPVMDGKIVGMISIVDVVRAVVEQQSGELKRLNEFIRGDYY